MVAVLGEHPTRCEDQRFASLPLPISAREGVGKLCQHPAEARRHVALQPQAQAPIDGLTPRSAIEIAGRLRGLSARDARRAATDLAEELDIGTWLDRRALPEGGGLSGGIRRLTGFAMAVAAPVPLLILDEPTNDIDASRRRLLWDAVRRRGDQGSGVLLITHNVVEAERS
ncbi:MAG: ATP-binding cassette domain-containing protein [Brachybacterium sp.]